MKYSEIKMPINATLHVNLRKVRYFAGCSERYAKDGKVCARSARLSGTVTLNGVECEGDVLANIFIRQDEFNAYLAGHDTTSVADVRIRIGELSEKVSISGYRYIDAKLVNENAYRIMPIADDDTDDWLGGDKLPTMVGEAKTTTMSV